MLPGGLSVARLSRLIRCTRGSRIGAVDAAASGSRGPLGGGTAGRGTTARGIRRSRFDGVAPGDEVRDTGCSPEEREAACGSDHRDGREGGGAR